MSSGQLLEQSLRTAVLPPGDQELSSQDLQTDLTLFVFRLRLWRSSSEPNHNGIAFTADIVGHVSRCSNKHRVEAESYGVDPERKLLRQSFAVRSVDCAAELD